MATAHWANPGPLALVTTAGPDMITVRVTGEVDLSNSSELETALRETIASSPKPVRCDLTDCPYIDSAGMAALLAAHKRLIERGQSLHLRMRYRSAPHKVMDISRFLMLFEIEFEQKEGQTDV